ncbi:MAG: hypothetical protein Q8S15_06985 [Erysipelotrichaceae bacterium]|nr:hypothetical protein [Erysipelotrichaceae bacterium]
MDRSTKIFGNVISEEVVKKANKSKQKYLKKFGDDSEMIYKLSVEDNKVLFPLLGIKNIVTQQTSEKIIKEKGIIIGNIRMGFGHYRISMAIASAAYSVGLTPYWFDLHAYSETTGGKVIKHLNDLYSMGSRWSQKYPLFNKFYWEPLNSEGFKKISYNAMDQKMTELMTPVFKELPKDMPFVATHVWPAQAAVHAGVQRVVNVIPDNWPMALHLAEGSIHTVQTPSSFIGYKTLREMGGKTLLNPMPKDQLFDVGHYIDHELVVNIDTDCERRLNRIQQKKAKRILLTVGGAGAQKEIFSEIIKYLLPKIAKREVALLINVGDHLSVWDGLCEEIVELKTLSETYFDDWSKTSTFAQDLLDTDVSGIHAFYNKDIFAAVYSSNLLMRCADILVTKPSELAFYPVPKLMIKRVGGHEAWGAIRAAEVGDGTIECETVTTTLQMLGLLLEDDEILSGLCKNIVQANKIGVYNGAYKVVELAIQNLGNE